MVISEDGLSNYSRLHSLKDKLFKDQYLQYCAIETGRGWKRKWNERESEFPFSLRIPFHFFSPEFSPVFTVATGEIRGIRFPQEGNVFLTWENEWKRVKTSKKLLVRFPRNSPEFPQNLQEFPWISPEFLGISPEFPGISPEFTGSHNVKSAFSKIIQMQYS